METEGAGCASSRQADGQLAIRHGQGEDGQWILISRWSEWALIETDSLASRQAAGTAQPSFVSNLIEQLSGEKGQVSPEDELIIKATAGTLYGGKF